jgi:16S rRNA (uracil1498-N3)-methyltransferase
MGEPRLFVSNDIGRETVICLSPSQSHYLLNVLRLREGSNLLLFNGIDGEWRARVIKAVKSRCEVQVVEPTREQTPAQNIHYAFAPLKHARLDYLIQKATELGVSRLQPVITDRTVATRVNLDRMEANAIEAAEQCNLLSLPEIPDPVKLETLLRDCESERAIIFCDEGQRPGNPLATIESLKSKPVTALVGPEGGFSPDERELLLSKRFVHPVSLGPRVMRADTAAVAILALLSAVLGDWR